MEVNDELIDVTIQFLGSVDEVSGFQGFGFGFGSSISCCLNIVVFGQESCILIRNESFSFSFGSDRIELWDTFISDGDITDGEVLKGVDLVVTEVSNDTVHFAEEVSRNGLMSELERLRDG